MLAELRNKIPSDLVPWAVAYLRDFTDSKGKLQSWLLPTEGLDGLNPDNLKKILHNWDVFQTKLEEFIRLNDNTEVAPEGQPVPAPGLKVEPEKEPWREIIVPFGKNKGVKFGDLEKGQLWWFCTVWKPEPWTSPKGKTYPPKDSDLELRKILDGVREKYGFTEKEEKK